MFNKNNYGMGILLPVPRFIFFCLLSLASTFFTYNWNGLIIIGSIILIIYLSGRIYYRLGIITSIVAGFLSFIGNIFIHKSGELLLFLGPLKLTAGGLEMGALLGLRLFFMILFAFAYISVTSLEEIYDTFKSFKLPIKGQIYLMIVLRYIDLLNKEFTTIKQAMAIRGINWNGSVLEKIRGLRLIPVPIIFRLIGHINKQTLSLDNLGGISKKKLKIETDSEKIIELKDVAVTYNLTKEIEENDIVLKDLSLNLIKGKKTILIGKNGSGKSTLLLTARGLISKSIGQYKGTIKIYNKSIENHDLGSLSEYLRIVFPSAAHGLVGIRVKDELSLSLFRSKYNLGFDKKKFISILEEVGLNENFLEKKILSLSGGQQQRIALASALISDPEILFFDEVSGQLDPIGKEEIFSSLKNISNTQSILVSEANLNPKDFDDVFFLDEKKLHKVDQNNKNFISILKKSGRRVDIITELYSIFKDNKIYENFDYLLKKIKDNQNNEDLLNLISPKKYKEKIYNKKILEISNLSFGYDKKVNVLHDINLSFYENQITSILGANGSGKSTLSLIMSKALKIKKGVISIKKNNRIGYIFQESSYQILSTKVKDEIAFGPKQLKFDEQHIQDIVKRECKRFNLNPEDNPINLSSEDLRKLTIASILAIDTDIIIFDEPTNTLDENEVKDLFEIITQLKELNKTVILISHDTYLSWKYSERIILLKDGCVIADKPKNEIFKDEELLKRCNISIPTITKIYNEMTGLK
mgnify:CR=1 FL=1